MKKLLIIVLIAVVAAAAYLAVMSSGASSASGAADEAWRGVEEAYAPRYSLMGEFASVLSGALTGIDAQYVDELSSALVRYSAAATVDEHVRAAGDIEASYTALLFALESGPRSGTVQSLVSVIASTESSVSVARTAYNAAVREYNRQAGRLPGQEARAYFQSADGI